MASPQCEDGYTKVANELLEALARIRIPGEARQVLDVIFRKTYGFSKKEDAISLSQFCLATGILKPNVCASLKQLREMNLIIQKDNGIANIYSINKDYTSWKPLSKKITTLSKKITTEQNNQQNQGLEGDNSIIQKDNEQKSIIQKDNESLSKKIPTKENIQKKIYCPNSDELRLSELLLYLIRQRNPNFKQPNIQSWTRHVDLMIRLDKRIPDEIGRIIQWCQADAFWQNNILSTGKLRKQYDQLCLKMTNGNGRRVAERRRYY
ncbi:MAG: replication protein [Candidatus Brocadia sinica]|nr:replication protein [Candidatus Brocadia sinica]